MPSKIPMTVSDTLLHIKDSDTTENVILPITRYDNVMNSPRVVTDGDNIGAPFVLLKNIYYCENSFLPNKNWHYTP